MEYLRANILINFYDGLGGNLDDRHSFIRLVVKVGF